MINKNICLLAVLISFIPSLFAQFEGLELELIDNKGLVLGKTYRVYALMQSEGDVIDAIYGEADSPLSLRARKGFFQHPDGGPLSKDILRFDLEKDELLSFDSWVTIGAQDNYQNSVAAFPPGFEESLASFETGDDLETSDGAWFVTPDQLQCLAGSDKRILLMQFTTVGNVTGTFGVHGRTERDDEGNFNVIQVKNVQFVVKKSFWSRLFKTDNYTFRTSFSTTSS